MKPRGIFALVLLFAFFTRSLPGQDVSDAIEQAIGGRTTLEANQRYVVTGTLERYIDTPDGRVQEIGPFTLSFDGDLTRLELSDRSMIRQGVLQQWWKPGGDRSSIQIGWEGLREVYLMPIWPVLQLKSMYQFMEANAERDNFQRLVTRRRFIGKRNKTDVVELSFHSQTHLLAEASFTTADKKQAPILITYEDYTRVNGLMVPSRVTRTIGDNPPWILLIDSVNFSPPVRSHEFDFEYRTREVAP